MPFTRHLSWTIALILLPSCSEHWYASDEDEVQLSGPGRVLVRVTTTPEAWPEDLYGDAVRATFLGDGVLSAVDAEGEVNELSDQSVNLLDAWDGCARDEVCVEVFAFDLECHGGCRGTFQVDAFLSTFPFPEPDRGGTLDVEVLARPAEWRLGG